MPARLIKAYHYGPLRLKGGRSVRCLIIHNARSGFGSSAVFEFERALIRGGDECTLRVLAQDETAEHAARDAKDYDLVVLSGGDGTTTSLLYALRNRDVLACVFPSGTANLFCINVGNAPEPAAMARACRIGRSAVTDLGEVTYQTTDGKSHTRGFSIMMGTGFDAQIMQDAVAGKQVLGEAAYFGAALSNAFPDVHHFKITVDGKTYERDGISCLVANNATIQGDIHIVPDARMDDGMLDVIVLEQQNAVGLLKPIIAALSEREGTYLGRPQIDTFRGRHVRVEPTEPVPLEYDGETDGELVTSYEARVLPRANRVVVDGLSPYRNPADPHSEKHPRFGEAEVAAYPTL